VRVAALADSMAQERARPRARAAQVLTVFSPKGGVGTSTLVVNLACALSARRHRVAIVDGNVNFGNVNAFLNIPPHKSMLQLVGDPNGIHDASVEAALMPHASGLKVLLAPPYPEEADRITADHLRAIIDI